MGELQLVNIDGRKACKKNNIDKREALKRIPNFVLTTFMYALAVLMLVPLIWMISTSFKQPMEIFSYPVNWIPKVITLDNYEEVWFGIYPFYTYYTNSLFVTLTTVMGAILFNSLAGYAFARVRFAGRDKIFVLYLAALMIPNQVTLVPKFLMFKSIGILDSHLALILPGIFQVLCVFLLRQFFLQIPFDFTEAALIDGAGEITTCFKVIMPLAKPAIVTLIVLTFTYSWNDYENPLIFLTSKNLYTLPLGLNHFVDEAGTRYGPMMAASVSSIILIIIIFLAGQKYFIEGLTSGGVKG